MIKIEQTGGKLTEEEILHGKNDAYGIYQINWKGEGREYAFLSFDSLRAKEKIPERKDYQLVYSGVLEPEENLDSLYMKFNIAHPDDFTGHSLSISDIVVLQRNGRLSILYIDMIGVVQLSDFYKEPQLQLLKEITESTKGFIAEGHFGTWHAIQMQEFRNEKFFQMRHDEFGEQVADIIVNEQGQVIAEDLWHGFSPEAVKLIGEYLLDKSLYEKKETAYKLSEDKGYFFIQETEEGYDYTFYDQEYQELDGGVYDNLDVSLTEAAEDILNEAGEIIENIVTIDYEELLEEVEEANERQMQRVQLEKNCPSTIFEDFDRKKALESYEGIAVQFTKSNGFLTIQATEEGYSYILYDPVLNEVHSSDYNNPDLSIQDATYEILKIENMENMECVKVDYEGFEKMTIQHAKDLLQKGEIHETSGIGRKEGALNGLSRSEVERGVLYHAQAVLEDVEPEKKVELIAARVTGSRSRQYLYRSDSDIDVVLSYKGDIREDSFFNALHASGIMMAGIIVDINPIAEERITLAEYMSEAEKYLDQQEIKKLATNLDNFAYEYDTYEYQDTIEDREGQVEKISEDILAGKTDDIKEWLTEIVEESDIDSDIIEARSLSSRLEEIEGLFIFDKQPEATISFYVAECMEFPSMGEYHNNLTLEEAIKIYENIPAERMHAVKGIGFDLQDGDEDYSGEYALMSADRIDYELIDMIPHYKESPLVQKAIADMERYLSGKHMEEAEEKDSLESSIKKSKERLQEGDITRTSEVFHKEKNLMGKSRAEIEEIVLSQAQTMLDNRGLYDEVKLIGARVYGSRSREGLYRPDSDLDVALSYEGIISEESLFNYLKENTLYVRDIPIDITPVQKEKSGTLPEYMKRAEHFLDEMEIEKFTEELHTFGCFYGDTYRYKNAKDDVALKLLLDSILRKKADYIKEWLKEIVKESEIKEDIEEAKELLIEMDRLESLSIFDEEPEPVPKISFYAAECAQAPRLGEYYEGLTIDEAIASYEKIPGNRRNDVKGIGIDLHFSERNLPVGRYRLFEDGKICKDLVDTVPFYKENEEVRKAIKQLEEHFDKKERIVSKKQRKKEASPRL